MANGLIGISGVVALLLVVGGAIGLIDRHRFDARWLLAAAMLVLINDALLTRAYAMLPDLLPAARWNWEGKLLALGFTLVVASMPAMGRGRAGLTTRQEPGSLAWAIPVALAYLLLPVGLALAFSGGPPTREEIAFQLTMPGLEEEAFYRGVLLLALDRAFHAAGARVGRRMGLGSAAAVPCGGVGQAADGQHCPTGADAQCR